MAGEAERFRWWRDAELFVVSALVLYLELVLIRWLGTEIRVLAYLGNLIVVVCFFGVGLGCYRAARPVSFVRFGFNLLLVVALAANPFHIGALDLHKLTGLLNVFEDLPIWGLGAGLAPWPVFAGLSLVAVLVYLVLWTFVPLGQVLGKAFDGHPRVVWAYSVNVAGSLAGVWLFNALSWRSTAPVIWFAVVALLTWPLVLRRNLLVIGLVALAAVAAWLGEEPALRRVWSPYHRLTLSRYVTNTSTNHIPQGYVIDVNGTFYQHMLDLSDGFLAQHPDVFDPRVVRLGHYDLPYEFKPGAKRVLIVGAGSGNDAAGALRHGAAHVECVDIDPCIVGLGRELHPEHPYDSPRVKVFINDARAMFKQATGPYDLIWFGWLDSHTLGSSYNNLRLDHYVYTRESLEEAKRLLSDDGVMVLSFGAERDWIMDRLAGMLRDVFGHEPLTYLVNDMPREFGGGALTFVTARQPVTVERLPEAGQREFVKAHLAHPAGTTRPTTDDWPYLYLESAKVPNLHAVASLCILGVVILVRRRVMVGSVSFNWHFFFLGAAFLLLEVQTVSRATLLFGMTWTVNAIVISAVLIMILLANAITAGIPKLPAWLPVLGLTGTVAALALVPLDVFNTLPGTGKLVLAGMFLTAPVFFAGLIFIRSFAASPDKAQALGSNLIGALVGGLLESLSFVTGIRALVVLVALFYLAAILTGRKAREA